jgi:hypothetical protein
LVWLDEAPTDRFEAPFTKVFGAASSNLCGGESGTEVFKLVC